MPRLRVPHNCRVAGGRRFRTTAQDTTVTLNPTRWQAHLAIARLDHAVKNVFVLPGVVIPLSLGEVPYDAALAARLALGLLAVTLISHSNYVLNEILDAGADRFHPTKRQRPAASGLIHTPLAYVQWLAMMAAGMALAFTISWQFAASAAALWIMGCLYNIPPLRTKDLPYIDVLSESINNPLRLLQGWYIATAALIPPVSLVMAYWMVGAYFMGLKRFSEYRSLNDSALAGAYRKSFRYYTERSLLVSVMFYAAAAMMLFGAFIMRYRVEWILSFPFVALVMAIYLHLAFDRDSAVAHPEKLYREPLLMTAAVLCVAVMLLLLWVDLPLLDRIFVPTLPHR